MFQVSPPEDMAQAKKAWHDGMMQEYAQGLIHVGNPPQMRQKNLKNYPFWSLVLATMI